MERRRVLIVDDEVNMRFVLSEAFRDDGYETKTASNGRQAIAAASESRFDAAVLDLKLPDMSGIDVFRELRQVSPGLIVVMVTAYSSVDTAVQAMKMGAFDYITKPFKVERLLMVIGNALEGKSSVQTLKDSEDSDRSQDATDSSIAGIVSKSPQMKRIIGMIEDLAPTNATVLLMGESGTGKGLLAEHIHKRSLRASRPFIKVNSASIPESLLESELFGHEKGAFTHAVNRRIGRFELAHTGTIFLDEVGEMSLGMQAKLLRILQDKEFERVGGTETLKTDVRIIAATNKDMNRAIAEGSFREDLYYRLSVLPIVVTPLRDRKEDIPDLCSMLIKRYNTEYGKKVKGLSPEAERVIMCYRWPGNVRELENVLSRAVLLCKSDIIGPCDLHIEVLAGNSVAMSPYTPPRSLEDIELEHIKRTLNITHNNRTEAARLLGITRRTLLNKIKKFGLAEVDSDDDDATG